ncbi:MAG: glycosyltransferase family 4 protein [Chromatiaceae bacterium]
MRGKERAGRIRMAVIEPSGNLYGSELALLDILTGLDPAAFAPRVYLPTGAAFSARLADAGVPFEELLLPRSHTQSRWRKALTYLRLVGRLRRQRPDLLYLNEAGILRPMSWIAGRLRLPILCQVTTIEDARWISSLTGNDQRVMAYVCNSDFTAAHTHVPERAKSIVYLGYRPKRLFTASVARPREPFRGAILGRIGGTKGHELVIDALALLRASVPALCWEVRFIGDTLAPSEWPAWEERIRQAGLASVIVPRGYRQDIKAELAELDLLLIPSREEPFGRILCEAAEAGVPVLLADAGGLGELSHRFGIGERHAPGDAADLARQLMAIREDYAAVAARFESGATRLLGALDEQVYLDVVAAMIRSVANREPVARRWYGQEGV